MPILGEVFRLAENIRITTRNSYLKLSDLFRKTSTRQNSLSYIGPATWNRIPEISKKSKYVNIFFFIIYLFNFFCSYLDLLFLWENKTSFLTNSGISLAGDAKVYSLDIHLDLHKGGRGQEWRGTMVNFGIKTDADLKEGQEINWPGGLC